MRNLIKFTALLITALTLTSCASLFLAKKQKVTIRTSSEDAEIFVNNEKFGEGTVATKKITKGAVSQVVILYGDDYLQKNEVLIPKTSRSPGYYVAQAFNVPFCLILYGIYAVVNDSKIPKAYPFEKEIKFETPPQKLPKRSEDSKYVYLSNIRLDINNADKEILAHWGTMKGDLGSTIARVEKETKEITLKNEKKDAKKKKKGKKMELLIDEKKDLKYENVIFTDELMRTLYNGGYIDTVNNVFSDNNNSLIIEGKIGGIDMFYISPNKSYNSGYICQARTDLVWYVKNTYGEILDSISDLAVSENFVYDDEIMKKTVGSSITESFYSLLEKEEFKKYSKIETDFDPKLELTKLNKPARVVTDKRDAADASVIVKTDNGHGSGFAITNDGYIITNYHVISDHNSLKTGDIKVIDSDGNEMDCKVVKVNKYQDIALLKVDKDFLKAFYCSNEKTFRKMDDVYTIGAPKSVSLGQSVAVGLISNERKVNNNYLIQLNMSVNSGNSGGPIFDSKGNLHGVVVSKLVGKNTEGVSFAVPSYLLTEYLNIEF